MPDAITLDEVKARAQVGATFEVLAHTYFPERAGERRKVIAVGPDHVIVERSVGGEGTWSWPDGPQFRGIGAETFEYDFTDPEGVTGTSRMRILPGRTCIEPRCWHAVTEEANGRLYCPGHAAEVRRRTGIAARTRSASAAGQLEYRRGDRVRLIACTDEDTRLRPGELGTVAFVDDLGAVHVAWDSGVRLGMITAAGDVIARVAEPEAEPGL